MNKSRSLLKSVLLLALIVVLSACDSGNSEDRLVTAGVIVANQGNFSDGTGSITAYDPETNTAATLVDNLGSIVQSIYLKGDSLYVMANTGQRVYVFSYSSGGRIAQVQGVVSPRHMTTNGSETGYVTNLYDAPGSFSGGSVTILDLSNHTVVDTINVGNQPEGILAVGPRLFVANNAFGIGTTVSVINQVDARTIGTIQTACHGPHFMAVDAEVEVFLACSGGTIYDNGVPVEDLDGELIVFDGATFNEVERVPITGKIQAAFGSGKSIFHSPETEEVFYVRNSNTVGRFNTATNSVIDEIAISGDPIGGVAYDHVNDKLYLGRVPAFDAVGSVTIHDLDGTQTGSFSAGIAPVQIEFVRDLE